MKKLSILLLVVFAAGLKLQAQPNSFVGAKKSEIIKAYKENHAFESPTLIYQTGLKYVKCTSLDGLEIVAFYLDENDICYKQINMYKTFNDFRSTKKKLDNSFAKFGNDTWTDMENTRLVYILDKKKNFYALHMQRINEGNNDICVR